MSLDVYLYTEGETHVRQGSGIFIRIDGQTKEVSREEWDEHCPGQEPYICQQRTETEYVFRKNITHNLGAMAKRAGIYMYLWRPDELMNVNLGLHLIEPLGAGLARLLEDPDNFTDLNPDNGWGTYEGLVEFVREYLKACIDYPQARIEVSR